MFTNDTQELIDLAKSVFAAGDESKIRFFCEKSQEYKQVSALVCLDVDVLFEIASNPKLTADELRRHIELLKENKDKAISDQSHRERRYYAGLSIFEALAAQPAPPAATCGDEGRGR